MICARVRVAVRCVGTVSPVFSETDAREHVSYRRAGTGKRNALLMVRKGPSYTNFSPKVRYFEQEPLKPATRGDVAEH